jgi:hypothetical protein
LARLAADKGEDGDEGEGECEGEGEKEFIIIIIILFQKYYLISIYDFCSDRGKTNCHK